MIVLTERQKKLAEQLLLAVIRKQRTITYSDLAERITPPMHHRNVGKDIGEISKLCHQLGLPLLSAMVVNKQSQEVGEGFYNLCEQLGIKVGSISESYLCTKELDRIRDCADWNRLAEYLELDLVFERPVVTIHPDEVSDKEIRTLVEGTTKRVSVNVYERNALARKDCIKKHGYRCAVCEFDFEKVYGKIGENFIHVHHIIPLHKIKKGYIVNGETDLVPVCPNCHAMLHKEVNGTCLSVEELRETIKTSRGFNVEF